MTGSANATDRAWSARNAEAVARFTGGQSEIDGVAAIVGSAFPVPPIILDTLAETQADVDNRRLEELRLTIAELPLTLQRDAKTFTLTSARAPVLPAGGRLEVGLGTIPLQSWPTGAEAVVLGEVPLSLQTDLVQFRLSIGDAAPAAWLQRVAVVPGIERDSAAISRLLSVAGLQAWLREMLEPEGSAGTEDDWDAEEAPGGSSHRHSWRHDGFALEDMLSAWSHDEHEKLKRVDSMLERYVTAIIAHSEHLSERDRRDLVALRETWAIARDVLVQKP